MQSAYFVKRPANKNDRDFTTVWYGFSGINMLSYVISNDCIIK